VWTQLAGVEYGYECFCALGYTNNTPPAAAPTGDCNMPCSGDNTTTCVSFTFPVFLQPCSLRVFTQLTSSRRCGGGYRIQIYASADAQLDAAALPTGWAQTVACAQDGSSRVYADTNLTTLANNTPRNCIGTYSFIICPPERRADARWTQTTAARAGTQCVSTHARVWARC
jgi:hypothetical protein